MTKNPPPRLSKRKSEEIRLKYLYRRLALSGKMRLPQAAARGLVGPDCAYHLYSKKNMD